MRGRERLRVLELELLERDQPLEGERPQGAQLIAIQIELLQTLQRSERGSEE